MASKCVLQQLPDDSLPKDYEVPDGHDPEEKWRELRELRRGVPDDGEPVTNYSYGRGVDFISLQRCFENRCTVAEACALLRVSRSVLEEHCLVAYGYGISEFANSCHMVLNARLREKMNEMAIADSSEKIITLLAKNYMGFDKDSDEGERKATSIHITFAELKQKRQEEKEKAEQ